MLYGLTIIRRRILPFLASILLGLLFGAGMTSCAGSQNPGAGVPTGQPPEEAEETAETDETMRTQESPEQTPPRQVETEAKGQQGQARVDVAEKDPFGEYITDAGGMSLYMFEADTRGQESTCYDACAEAWPPMTVEDAAQATAGEDANEALVGTIERRDGELQLTYGGWPLYYFARDQQPGDTTGQDVEGFGAEWYLVSPAGEVIHEEPAPVN
jgi:predicted lipoprotein with Yx(FWY)xxD motif